LHAPPPAESGAAHSATGSPRSINPPTGAAPEAAARNSAQRPAEMRTGPAQMAATPWM